MTEPVWGPPEPAASHPQPTPPRRGLPTPVILILAVAGAVALLGVIGAVAVAIGRDGEQHAAGSTATGRPSPGVSTATAATDTTATAEPTGQPGGSKPKTVVMPNLVGRSAAVAGDELNKLGLIPGFVPDDPNSEPVYELTAWIVTRQSPEAGTSTPIGTLIVLTCVKKR